MNKIIIEVPTTQNEARISIPYGENEDLWQFFVLFSDCKELSNERIVTVFDKKPGEKSGKANIDIGRETEFTYEHEGKSVKLEIKFLKGIRLIRVSWT
jgi:hypothetical protein